MPIIGIFTALCTCHTIRTATGNTAAPENPPALLAMTGLRVLRSMRIPRRVLMSERPSAPADSTALAMLTMFVTLGVSFTYTGFDDTALTARVTSAAFVQSVPKAAPPP